MTDIPLDHRKKNILIKERQESLTVDNFKVLSEGESEYSYINQLLFKGIDSVEFIPQQDVQSGSSVIHYQIPHENRGSNVIENSVVIEYGGNTYNDDGDGNLYNVSDENTNVGNIWYNTGNIIFKNEAPFTNFVGNNVQLSFKREVYFVENKLYIDVNSGQYNRSSNETFNSSNIQYPFVSCIYLYNEDNELIAKAQLSKPISTEIDLFFVLDDLETV